MLIMPPVPNQVIKWICKYTRILWVAQHLLQFFFQIQFFPSCGKEPLLASVSPHQQWGIPWQLFVVTFLVTKAVVMRGRQQ